MENKSPHLEISSLLSPHLASPKGRGIYRILFVSALSAELKIVKQEIKKLNISKNIEISFFESGMWNYKIIMNLWIYLVKQKFDFIVNIWVCWYYWEYEKLIQVSVIKNISNNKELISPIFFEFSKIKSIFCSEQIIDDVSLLFPHLEREGARGWVDMESYWFEMIWNKFESPRIILKVPVDKIWEETKKFDFEKAKMLLAENINYSKLLEEIEKYLDKNNNKDFSEKENILKNKILNFYKWTFSEKLILEKELNRFIVLKLWNLENFFEENKQLNKKEFLNKLKNLW